MQFVKCGVAIFGQVHLHAFDEGEKMGFGYGELAEHRLQVLRDGMRGIAIVAGVELGAPLIEMASRFCS